MIPVRLVLKDFLSYASPPPLDFTTFDVACLSGDNGVGKSALLDAITWSVWGCARGCESGQNQERIIRDGADETVADFTFDLGSDRYRVVRTRPRTGKAEVRFLVRDGERWKNIAAETLRETDAKIASVLRMDYRTFTASAFFLQGHSEDFLARMRPDERKDVFARLLDLGSYEKLEEAARERARDAERDRKEAEARIDDLAATIPDIGALESNLAEIEASTRGIEERSAAASVSLQASRDALAALQGSAVMLRAERDALSAAEEAAAGAEADEARKLEELRSIEDLLGRKEEVEEAIAESEKLTALEAEAREQQARAANLETRRTELAAVIEGERRAIADRCDSTRTQIVLFEAEIAELEDAKSRLAAIEDSLGQTTDPSAALEEARSLQASLAADGARFKEQIDQLESAAEKTQRALDVLADGGGECPVCGTSLDAKHRAKVKRDLNAEFKQGLAARDAAHGALEVARKDAILCREEIRRLERASAERDELNNARRGFLGRLERLDAASAEHVRLVRSLHADEAILSQDGFATEERRMLGAIEAEARGLYDAVAHSELQRRLAALAPYAEIAGRLTEATRTRERLVADIDACRERVADTRRLIAERSRAIAALDDELKGLDEAERAVAEGDALLESLRHLAADAAAEQGRLQERLTTARSAACALDTARAQEQAAAEVHRRYRRLTEAFGPAGIPKLIIDNALPELTHDANQILGHLSDHEMSIRFVLQRQTKAGKAKETFEALVHHDGGVRDFAMFSGGEAFRVAFAVRLAMSKLLVRRAGARLETLVIDEGFGTQDPEGRERLVQAINLARQEFAKVLVITHLDELKDQFGSQIRVEKGIAGSSLAFVDS